MLLFYKALRMSRQLGVGFPIRRLPTAYADVAPARLLGTWTLIWSRAVSSAMQASKKLSRCLGRCWGRARCMAPLQGTPASLSGWSTRTMCTPPLHYFSLFLALSEHSFVSSADTNGAACASSYLGRSFCAFADLLQWLKRCWPDLACASPAGTCLYRPSSR